MTGIDERKKGRPHRDWLIQTKNMKRRNLEDEEWDDSQAWRRGCERWPRGVQTRYIH